MDGNLVYLNDEQLDILNEALWTYAAQSSNMRTKKYSDHLKSCKDLANYLMGDGDQLPEPTLARQPKSKPVKIDIPKEIMFMFDGGFQEEYQMVDAIRRYLLTTDQSYWLSSNGITIEAILNGRIEGDNPVEVVEMLTDWNNKLGSKYFFSGRFDG